MTTAVPTRLAQALSITIVTRFVTVGGSFLGGIVVARYLGAGDLGIYAVLVITVNALVQIVGAGLASASVYFAGRDTGLFGKIAANALWYALVVGLSAAALVYGLAALQPGWFGNVPPRLLFLALVTLPFQLWTLFGLNLFLARGEFVRFNLLDLLSQAHVPVNAVLILLIFRGTLGTLVTANLAATALVAIVIAVQIWRASRDRGENAASSTPDIGLFARMMRYGLLINIMNASLALMLRADVLLVNYFRGEAEAGIYSIAAQCSLLLIMFPNVVGTVLFPKVASMTTGAPQFTSSVVRHAAAAQLVLSFLAVPFAFLLPIIYGAEFSPAVYQFLILIPGALALGLQMILSQHLAGIGRINSMPIFWIVTLTFSLFLQAVLIPAYGAIAAAAVSTIGYLTIFILTLTYFLRVTKEDLADVLLLRPGETRAFLARLGW